MSGTGCKKDIREGSSLRSQQITENWSRVMRKVCPSRTTEDIEIDAGFSPCLYKGLESILL